MQSKYFRKRFRSKPSFESRLDGNAMPIFFCVLFIILFYLKVDIEINFIMEKVLVS